MHSTLRLKESMMIEFTVQYELDGCVYQSKIWTDKSGSAMLWVKNLFPNAKNVYIVSNA